MSDPTLMLEIERVVGGGTRRHLLGVRRPREKLLVGVRGLGLLRLTRLVPRLEGFLVDDAREFHEGRLLGLGAFEDGASVLKLAGARHEVEAATAEDVADRVVDELVAEGLRDVHRLRAAARGRIATASVAR